MEEIVSVLVITYNSSDTIIECLDSVYNQSYPNIELIVSDDASQDDTVDIVKKWFANNEKRFTGCKIVLASKNRGVVKNCNAAAFAATGKYLEFLAGDDMLPSNSMERKVAYAEKNNSDIVFCKVKILGDNIQKVNEIKRFCNNGYRIISKGYEAQHLAIMKSNFISGPSGCFIKRSFFEKCGGYDERFPMLEDYPFFYKYIVAGNEIQLLDEELEYYRVTGKSLCTSTGSSRLNKCHIDFFYRVRLLDILRCGRFDLAKELVITNLCRITKI